MQCEYGCAQQATHQFKNRKWCCHDSYAKCPGMKKKFISLHNASRVCTKCDRKIPKSSWNKHIISCKVNTCPSCDSLIDRSNKFCNSSCAAIYNNKHSAKLIASRRGPKSVRKCEICDNQLKSDQKIYCSLECRNRSTELKIINSEHVGSKTVKRYLCKIRGARCEICGNTKWMGDSIPLILDHIDGNSDNSALENFRLVCGNCDMQLPTYKGKNAGNGRHYRRKRYKEGKSY